MNEDEWLKCARPAGMLHTVEVTASQRRLRLFASACCRRLTSFFKDERSQRMIEVSDQFADAQVSLDELNAAFDEAVEAQEAIHWEGGDSVDQASAESVLGLREELDFNQILGSVEEVARAHESAQMWEQITKLPPHRW